MTLTALIYATIFVVLTFALVVWHFWPRHEDGKPFGLDEVEDLMKRFQTERQVGRDGSRMMMLLIAAIATIAIALSRSKE